jgi:hypothetical protein
MLKIRFVMETTLETLHLQVRQKKINTEKDREHICKLKFIHSFD